MITPNKCIVAYGDPTPEFESMFMKDYIVPDDIHQMIVPLPKRIYMNIDMIQPFENALIDICNKGFSDQIKEFGGVFCIRNMRGVNPPTKSIHSWGIAIDINETIYPQRMKLSAPPDYAQCFIDNGFDWGNGFPIPDPMHFQLSQI
jgi:hypothetical protein